MRDKSIRYGRVSSINPEMMTAKVLFDDEDNNVTDELEIIVRNSKNNKDYALPDVGEYVVCLFLDNDRNSGFIVGAVYSSNNMPLHNNADVRAVDFADGTSIEYNRATGSLRINCTGDLIINARNIYLNEG